MKKLITFIVMISILLGMVGCQKKEETVNTIKTKEEDLIEIFNTLEAKHKNLYANITKEELQQEIEQVKENVNEMSDAEFYYSVLHLLTLVQDAHTTIGYSNSKYAYEHGLPFAIAKFEDNWHTMILDEAYKAYLGYRVVSINDMSIQEIYEKAKTIIPHENDAWIDQSFSNTINFQEALIYLGVVEENEEIVLYVEDDKQELIPIPLTPLNEQEIKSAKLARVERNTNPSTSLITNIYNYQKMNDDTLFIQYNSCQEDPKLPMKDFTKQVEAELDATNYKTIIFDLRYNSGGNSEVIQPLFNMIKKSGDYTFYTLIGNKTFSSGIMNAIDTQEMFNSQLVGTPTGGTVNGYGELKSIETLTVPFIVYYSTKYFELIKGYDKDSLYPDIEIKQTYEDYLNGVDPEVTWVLENSD